MWAYRARYLIDKEKNLTGKEDYKKHSTRCISLTFPLTLERTVPREQKRFREVKAKERGAANTSVIFFASLHVFVNYANLFLTKLLNRDKNRLED